MITGDHMIRPLLAAALSALVTDACAITMFSLIRFHEEFEQRNETIGAYARKPEQGPHCYLAQEGHGWP